MLYITRDEWKKKENPGSRQEGEFTLCWHGLGFEGLCDHHFPGEEFCFLMYVSVSYWAWHHQVLAHFSFAESFRALKLAQHSKSYIKGTRVPWILLESLNLGVLKSWGDLWIPPGGAFRCCCEVWSQSYSAATKLCIHKLWCLETRQGIEIIKVVMLSKQNLSMYHQLESCNKEGKKKKFIRLLHIRGDFLYLCIIMS